MTVFLAVALLCLLAVCVTIRVRRELATASGSSAGTGLEVLLWIGSGVLLLALFAVLGYGRLDDSPTGDRVVLPKSVQDALEASISTGIVTRGEAAEINRWLNAAVRERKRYLGNVVVDYEVGFPRALLERVRDGSELSVAERSLLLKWFVDSDNVPSQDVCVTVLDVLRGVTVSDTDRESLARWLAEGPAHAPGIHPAGWSEPSLWQSSPDFDPAPAVPEVTPAPPAP